MSQEERKIPLSADFVNFLKFEKQRYEGGSLVFTTELSKYDLAKFVSNHLNSEVSSHHLDNIVLSFAFLVHGCTNCLNLEMEPKYLTKSDIYLRLDILRTKNNKRVSTRIMSA